MIGKFSFSNFFCLSVKSLSQLYSILFLYSFCMIAAIFTTASILRSPSEQNVIMRKLVSPFVPHSMIQLGRITKMTNQWSSVLIGKMRCSNLKISMFLKYFVPQLQSISFSAFSSHEIRLNSCVSMTFIVSEALDSSSHLFIVQFIISSFIHRPGTRLFNTL